jgi:hypothetical protein
VPNTDWLEVYYEGKNYTNGNTVQDETSNDIDATIGAATTFDSVNKAWSFSGTSNRDGNEFVSGYLPSDFEGNQIHSVSMWLKFDYWHDGAFCIIGRVDRLNSDAHKAIHFQFQDTSSTRPRILYDFWDNQKSFYLPDDVQPGKWLHMTATYTGNAAIRKMFVNGQELTAFTTNSNYATALALDTTNNLVVRLGSRYPVNSSYIFHGDIANFRLFNRPLTSDEIWQLYAYQKEYFGHGDLGMTLKAGRLGIGTSEPRAMLDVRGDLRVDGHTQLETLAPRYYSSMQRGTFHNVSSHIITGFDHQAEGYATPALGWEVHINFNHHRNSLATHVEIDGGYLSTAPGTHVAISEVATRKYDEDTSAFTFYTDKFYIGSDIANAHAAAHAVIRITNSQVPGIPSAIHAGNSSTVRYHMLGHTMYVKPAIGSCLDVAIGKISGGDNARLHGIRVATGADNITGSYTVYTYH